MPDPGKYKNKAHYMEDCMHQTVKQEGKSRNHGVAQCLSMWRQEKGGKKPKKASYDILLMLADRMLSHV
jgi:hypothetical protein